MSRRARNALNDGLFHVTSRGNRGQHVFADDGDRRFFIALLDRVTTDRKWCLGAYCLLATHYHLLVDTTVANLSAGMMWLNGRYAQGFNSRHGLAGHLFEDRFYSGPVEGDGHLFEVIRYIALNPVRGGMCTEASRWPWGSYRELIGRARGDSFVSHSRILELFSTDEAKARELIRTFVTDV